MKNFHKTNLSDIQFSEDILLQMYITNLSFPFKTKAVRRTFSYFRPSRNWSDKEQLLINGYDEAVVSTRLNEIN